MAGFIQKVQIFGALFVELRRLRQIADYAPDSKFARSEVAKVIEEVEGAITYYNAVENP